MDNTLAIVAAFSLMLFGLGLAVWRSSAPKTAWRITALVWGVASVFAGARWSGEDGMALGVAGPVAVAVAVPSLLAVCYGLWAVARRLISPEVMAVASPILAVILRFFGRGFWFMLQESEARRERERRWSEARQWAINNDYDPPYAGSVSRTRPRKRR